VLLLQTRLISGIITLHLLHLVIETAVIFMEKLTQ